MLCVRALQCDVSDVSYYKTTWQTCVANSAFAFANSTAVIFIFFTTVLYSHTSKIAIKNNIDVFYFSTLVPLHVMFLEDGEMG